MDSLSAEKVSAKDGQIRVQRISYTDLPPVERVRFTVLVDDSIGPEGRKLVAKHGLSFHVEITTAAEKTRIIMDAGPPKDIAVRNADTVGIDLRQVDAIVISHGHYDHTGGLEEFLRLTAKQVPVIIHPEAFSPKFALSPKLRFIGMERSVQTSITSRGVPVVARNSVRISRGVMTSGEVTRLTEREKSEGFWKVTGERFMEDQVTDEQALLINLRDRGLIIVTGCAHPGIINIVNHARKVSKVSKVCAIIGGFHLTGSSHDRLEATTKELSGLNPELVCPCHCTGSSAIGRLSELLGPRCKPVRTGDSIEL